MPFLLAGLIVLGLAVLPDRAEEARPLPVSEAYPLPDDPEDPPLRVTPDGPETCRDLQARLARLPASRAEPYRGLADEGRALCAAGHVRTGASRLRRAIRGAVAGPVEN